MSHMLHHSQPTSRWMTVEKVRSILVAMIFITSFVSLFEPAPTDVFLVLALLTCFRSGLKLSPMITPLVLLLLIYNLSGLVSYLNISHDRFESHIFLVGLALTSVSGMFVAYYVAADPVNRFLLIQRSWCIGAAIGAAIGLASYFKIEPIATMFPDFGGRAVGAYKDPNVYSTWLVPPAILMLQGFLTGRLRLTFFSITGFLLIYMALFLAFSRGAWLNTIVAAAITIGLTFLLSPTRQLRGRIGWAAIIGIGLMAVGLVVLLSIPQTRELFLDRFTLVKSYDAGETGRFGNQLNSIPLLLNLPLGFGPYQFGGIYGLAPHNTFLNSFSSAGWTGGIAYVVLTVCNLIIGLKVAFTRTPFQPFAIAMFGCLVGVTMQGVQIDTEHWRHFYWTIGLLWGFFAASHPNLSRSPRMDELALAWNLKAARP